MSCDELVDDVFDDVTTTLRPAHLIQVRVVCHLNNMSKRVRSKLLLFLLIVCLDHSGFMASRVVAAWANQRREAALSENVRAGAHQCASGYRIDNPGHQVWGSHSGT